MKRLWAVGFLLVCGTAVAGEVEDLVAQATAAYGKPERLDRLDAYRVEGQVTALIRGGKGRLLRDLQAPMKLRVDLAYPDRREIRILDGQRGWRGGSAQSVPATGMQLDSMAYQFLRSDIPRVLDAYPAKLESLGTKSREGHDFAILRLHWSDQLDVDYWLETSSHRITRVEGHLRQGEMAFDFATQYSDFREVDGLLFPFREENHAGGNHVATTIVESVTLDPKSPGPFAPQ